MIYLTLNNGTKIEVTEASTTSAIVVSGSLANVNTAMAEITTDTLKNADLNGTTLVNKVYTGFSGKREDDVYTVTFSLRDKTDMEIMRQDIDDANAALVELAEMIGG